MRRGLLLGWMLWLAVQGLAQAQHQHHSQSLAAGAVHSSLALDVAAIGETRLALQFELPLAVTQARLTDPAGQVRSLLPGRDLLVIDAAQRQPQAHRARGHLLVLKQPVIDPLPGRWRLDVDHAAARGREPLQLLASQFPRFELRLSLVGADPVAGTQPRVGAGSEQLLQLHASDQGLPMVAPVQASVLHLDSGQRQPLAFWHERPPRYDLPVQAEPGQAFAAWSPLAPGRYRVDVQQDVVGRDGQARPLQRQLDLAVAAQPVWSQLSVAQVPGPQGCVAEVVLSADWTAARAGRYVLTVWLEGGPKTVQRQTGVTASRPGPIRLAAVLLARDLLPLGQTVAVRRADLLFMDDADVELLQRRRDLPLAEPVATTRLCR